VYLAQIKGYGCRNWETLGKPLHSKAQAATRAVGEMIRQEAKRARVLFCADWYDPIVVVEASV
jgi:hypothetical protein